MTFITIQFNKFLIKVAPPDEQSKALNLEDEGDEHGHIKEYTIKILNDNPTATKEKEKDGDKGSEMSGESESARGRKEREVRIDAMTYKLSQEMDGTIKGDLRALLGSTLTDTECMLLFHPPSKGNYACTEGKGRGSGLPCDQNTFLTVVLAWRLPTRGDRGKEDHRGMLKKENKKVNDNFSGDIVMEMARSDADEPRISRLLQTYIDALNATPASHRDSQMSDIIRALSVTFALGELLALLPKKVS